MSYSINKKGFYCTKKFIILLCLSFLSSLLCNLNIKQAIASDFLHKQPNFIQSPKYSAIIINQENKKILYEKNSKKLRYPASLTKMMTLYLVFDELKKGNINMKSQIYISKDANTLPESNLRVATGDFITIEEAIYALIVRSANNISYALAEKIGGGDYKKFITMMNRKAKQLRMRDTTFKNPHGLHNYNNITTNNVTTAYDMAILAMALSSHHRKYYKMFSMSSFNFRGRTIKGHNNVLVRYKGSDGIKTGYTRASGYNLVTSVKRPEGKILAVVIGGDSAARRDQHMINLLEVGYAKIKESQGQYRNKSYKKKYIAKNYSNRSIFDIKAKIIKEDIVQFDKNSIKMNSNNNGYQSVFSLMQ